jgi:hypothetical protein
MNITVESVLMIALVLYALYLLVNTCGCKEGMKDSGDPENSSDCERLCKERGVGLSRGQQCVYDKGCKYGGIGCKIGGVSLCRLCDNDESSEYLPCSPPPPPPPPPPSPSPSPSPPPPPPPPQKIHGYVVDNKTVFDLSILDLDPKNHYRNRKGIAYRYNDWSDWGESDHWEMPSAINKSGWRPINNPDVITLLNNLKEHAGFEYIEVDDSSLFYEWNIGFYSNKIGKTFEFWDESGDYYRLDAKFSGGHNLSYSSDKPKLTGLRVY